MTPVSMILLGGSAFSGVITTLGVAISDERPSIKKIGKAAASDFINDERENLQPRAEG